MLQKYFAQILCKKDFQFPEILKIVQTLYLNTCELILYNNLKIEDRSTICWAWDFIFCIKACIYQKKCLKLWIFSSCKNSIIFWATELRFCKFSGLYLKEIIQFKLRGLELKCTCLNNMYVHIDYKDKWMKKEVD